MYTDFYHLSEKPFDDNPDPKFLYLPPSLLKTFASILTWIKEGHGFALITGEPGIGKTFFIHALVSHLGENINPILVGNPISTFKDLLKQILLDLKRPSREESETGLFHRFIEVLDQMTAQDQTLLIILDEAQKLNDRTLEGMDRFLDLRDKQIRIIFVGEPKFDERLNSTGLRRLGQKINANQNIEPFTEEESRGYIDHRLRLVGSSSEIITPKALSMICSYTRGISGSINHVCDNALWIGYTMSSKKIDIDIVGKVVRNLEGPRMTPKVPPSFQPPRQIWNYPIPFPVSYKGVSMALLFLICLGGLVFLLNKHMGRGSVKTQELKSYIGQKATTRPSIHKPSPQETTNKGLEKDSIPPPGGAKPTQPEISSLQRDGVLLTVGKGNQQLTEVVVVKRGETLFRLVRNYYHIANPTLIDLILQSNPEVTNADIIKVDHKMKMPKITEESLLSQSPDQTFKIHVGTFWSSELPKVYRDEPALNGKTIEIMPLQISPTEIWYRVLVGKFQNRDEALNMVFSLKKKRLLPSFEGGLKTD